MIKIFKKFKFSLFLIFLMAFASNGSAVEVDSEVSALIEESIRLELIHNSSFKDPIDGLPLDVDYSSMQILGMSVEFYNSDDNLVTYTYQVSVLFKDLDGDYGSLLCSALYSEDKSIKKASRATCSFYSAPASFDADTICDSGDVNCLNLKNKEDELIDEQ